MNIIDQIKAVQSAIGVQADGNAGPQTWGELYRRLVPEISKPTVTTNLVDSRSEGNIATLLPEVQPYARALVMQALQQGITIVVTSGSRTYAEQDALFAKGGVTKARGGQSNHNFGLAFDVTIFSHGQPVWESPAYKAIGAIGKSLGLSWGGDWTSIVDEPHFELRPEWASHMGESAMLSELRSRHDKGIGAFA